MALTSIQQFFSLVSAEPRVSASIAAPLQGIIGRQIEIQGSLSAFLVASSTWSHSLMPNIHIGDLRLQQCQTVWRIFWSQRVKVKLVLRSLKALIAQSSKTILFYFCCRYTKTVFFLTNYCIIVKNVNIHALIFLIKFGGQVAACASQGREQSSTLEDHHSKRWV